MARIVLGMAVPHSGMLGKSPDTWLEDGERDRKNNGLWFRNQSWTFAELKAHRASENFAPMLALDERRARGGRCTAALDVLRRVYREINPDVAIILAKDQKEMFNDVSPSFAIYTGDTIENGPPQRSVYAPAQPVTYAAHAELAQHLLVSFQRDGFDFAEVLKWSPNTWTQNKPIVPHGFGFIYQQIMAGQPPPSVPIFLNCFYPPNQPSMARSLQFGKSLFEAVKAWDTDKRVAIIASGGLTHFVCDEQLDRRFMRDFSAFDFDDLVSIDNRSYQSGTSEVKLYVPILWAMQQLGCKLELVDYVPCYRTEAGTGEGFAFMYWQPPQAH
jgi:3-O-methylgallate 3,4-dioxygenase